ncbi:hypothetical protein ACFLXQ_01420 [Chloroflexota bacterium]
MAFQNYIVLNGLRYKVSADGYEPGYDILRTHTVGLTAKTIVQDFTVVDALTLERRDPTSWRFLLRVYINDPETSNYGVWDDLLTAFQTGVVSFTEHDDTFTHDVLIDGPLFKKPQVAANIAGLCNGRLLVDTTLTRVYS